MLTRNLFLQYLILGAAAIAIEKRQDAPADKTAAPVEFDWSKHPSSYDLNFAECYTGLECSTLTVPMSWTSNSLTNSTVNLAIMTSPAAVPLTDPSFGGFMLFNPGGPGVSGTSSFLQGFATIFRNSYPSLNNYTLVAFDPRGVGKTTPSLDCFNTTTESQAFNDLSEPILEARMTGREHARWKALWGSCKLEIQSYASTPDVARDMLEIHDKLWAAVGEDGKAHDVNYLGISYGTALGMTFAQMYPDRVGKMFLDSVIDIHDMTSGRFDHFFDDNDKSVLTYLKLCYEAGEEVCPFATGVETVDGMEVKLDKLLARLKDEPVVLEGTPQYVTDQVVLSFLRGKTYTPTSQPNLNTVLEMMWTGTDGGKLGPLLLGEPSDADPFDCVTPAPYSTSEVEKRDVFAAITCATTQVEHSLKALRKKLKALEKQSKYGGGAYGAAVAGCAGWVAPALGIPKIKGFGTKTKNPILFAGNGADPITPLRNALEMSKIYEGSGVVSVPNGLGHGTLSTQSECANEVVSKYFVDGIVEPGTVVECDVEMKIFPSPEQSA